MHRSIVRAAALICSLGMAGCPPGGERVPALEPGPDGVIYLDQGWSEDDRQRFYHATEGAKLLPLSWFLALEEAGAARPFRSDDHLRRFGVIPDPTPAHNPDRLPVGFAVTVDPDTKQAWLGFTCAACHTGEVAAGGRRVRIDGGPAMLDSRTLPAALGQALAATVKDREKLGRFAKAVLKDAAGPEATAKLAEAVTAYLARQQAAEEIARQHNVYPVEWGFGRLDALGRGGNLVLTQLDPRNLRPAGAPVSFPALWGAYELEWVQWNGSIQQPMGRNLGQAIGINAPVAFAPGPDQFRTTVGVLDLAAIESLVQKLRPPAWPAALFGTPDPAKVARGRALYDTLCAHCHVPKMTPPDEFGRSYKAVNMIPLEEIGTDPVSAVSFNGRRVKTGVLGLGEVSAAEATEYLTNGIRERQYRELGLSPERQRELDGHRPNRWRAPLAYLARPHVGVWALAPYLHNGSVPTLYQLLSPREERDTVFSVGNTEFDPVNVGYVSTKAEGTFQFRTDQPGNSNAGHEFRDGPIGHGVIGRALSEQERRDLVEFLKTR